MQHASEHVDGRSLASAVVAEDRTDLVLSDGKREVINSLERAEFHRHVFELDRVLCIELFGTNMPQMLFLFVIIHLSVRLWLLTILLLSSLNVMHLTLISAKVLDRPLTTTA